MDDQYWHQAMVTYHRLDGSLAKAVDACTDDKYVLRALITRGILDDGDKKWMGATRAMWQSSEMADCLLVMLKKEQERVQSSSRRMFNPVLKEVH
jgi:ribonuclease HI